MEVTIRTMAPADAVAVHRLSAQLGYELSVEQTKQQINTVLLRNDHCAFVACVNGEVAGWIHAFIANTIESNPFVEIGGLVIDESCRSKGIGKMLVDTIKQWCVEQNVLSMRVRSNVKRTGAHRFYLKTGFTPIKEQKVFALELG